MAEESYALQAGIRMLLTLLKCFYLMHLSVRNLTLPNTDQVPNAASCAWRKPKHFAPSVRKHSKAYTHTPRMHNSSNTEFVHVVVNTGSLWKFVAAWKSLFRIYPVATCTCTHWRMVLTSCASLAWGRRFPKLRQGAGCPEGGSEIPQ